MFKSLDDFLQKQREKERAKRRKLHLLQHTVRNNDNEEIITALTQLSDEGIDFRNISFDYLFEYLRASKDISCLVVMLMLNMSHSISADSISYLQRAFKRTESCGGLREEDRAFLSNVIFENIKKERHESRP